MLCGVFLEFTNSALRACMKFVLQAYAVLYSAVQTVRYKNAVLEGFEHCVTSQLSSPTLHLIVTLIFSIRTSSNLFRTLEMA